MSRHFTTDYTKGKKTLSNWLGLLLVILSFVKPAIFLGIGLWVWKLAPNIKVELLGWQVLVAFGYSLKDMIFLLLGYSMWTEKHNTLKIMRR